MDGKLPFFLYSCVLGILLSKRTEHLGATKKKNAWVERERRKTRRKVSRGLSSFSFRQHLWKETIPQEFQRIL
jgi:hypothetical protein